MISRNLLTDDEIASALKHIDQLISWGADLKEFALAKAVTEGKKWEGMKVVEGRSQKEVQR